jgi:sortase (surface protein transpeptidase)
MARRRHRAPVPDTHRAPAPDEHRAPAPDEHRAPATDRRPAGPVARTVSGLGEVLITLGLVALLLVVYEVYWTDVVSAGKQADAQQALDQQWDGDAPTVGNGRTARGDLPLGQGFAKLYVPTFGSDYEFTVLEGTDAASLEAGPGHYVGTALPGEPGNFAVAGHRVGKGAPFNDLDQLRSCDAVVVETRTDYDVYRVLPMADEVSGWATGAGTRASCAARDGSTAVAPLPAPYADVVGQEVVLPSDGAVIDPVPGSSSAEVPADAQRLLTLTTCTPKFSASQRLIVHAVLVRTAPKTAGPPPELTGG